MLDKTPVWEPLGIVEKSSFLFFKQDKDEAKLLRLPCECTYADPCSLCSSNGWSKG